VLKNRPYIYIKFITTMKKLLFFLIIFASCNGGGSKINTVPKPTTEEFQFEEFLSSDLEKMAEAGKLKYDKSSRIYTLDDILKPKGKEELTDDDYKILFRSTNFRHAMYNWFSLLNIDVTNPIHVGNLTGKYAKIWHIWGLFNSTDLLAKVKNAELTDDEIKVDTSY